MTIRLTVAQAIISFLKNQYSERDGVQQRLFEGCLGIFGHGNVAGLGQALEQDPGLPYYLFRNEQGMVHAAAAFAKTSNRSGCHGQPPARTASAWRYLCTAQRGACPAATGVFNYAGHFSERLF
jgi:TPP-dependent trihydroxycyclohexane-1,2-dione (THcHDO) dehydratase